MNSIRKHETGQFVLYDSNGEPSVQLGDSIEVRLRTLNSHPVPAGNHSAGMDYLEYTVEIVRSTFHNYDPLSSTNLVKLLVSTEGPDNDWRIAASVFRDEAFGQVHRLGLFKGVLTIGGLLWDQGIRHVRDIAA